MRAHDHDIDGKLHDGCVECQKIIDARLRADRDIKADQLAERYEAKAMKGKGGGP